MRFLVLGLALLLTACPRGAPTPATPLDSEPDAGGEPDGGTGGGGEGEGEGEPPDAGENADGGADAGVLDAGAADAGVFDAGPQFPFDGGPEPLCDDPALHNGGDGACVAVGVCSADYFLRPDGRCTAWRATAPLPVPVRTLRLVVDGLRLYLLGTHEDRFRADEAQTSLVDGELETWRVIQRSRRDDGMAAVAIHEGRVFVLGGMDPNSWATSRALSVAEITPDGAIGAWSIHSAALTVPRRLAAAFVRDDVLYVHGGQNGNDVLSTIEAIPLLPDGGLGPASLIGATPGAAARHHGLLVQDHLLLAGGGGSLSSPWVWSAGSGFPDVWDPIPGYGVTGGTCILAVGDELVSIGGLESFDFIGTKSSDLVFAARFVDGAVEDWEPRGPLDIDRRAGDCAIVGDYMVVVGGSRARSGFDPVNLVSIAKVDAVLRSVEAP
jgi:hypothetical protein